MQRAEPELSEPTARWNAPLRDAIAAAVGEPANGRRWSWGERVGNQVMLGQLRRAVLRQGAAAAEDDAVTARVARAVREVAESPWRFLYGSAARGVERGLRGALARVAGVLEAGAAMREALASWERQLRAIAARHPEGVTPGRVQRAAYDVLAMWLVAVAAGGRPRSPDAVVALALLHPVCDDAADAGVLGAAGAARIARVLAGEALQAEGPFEALVFELLSTLDAAHAARGQSRFGELMAALHRAQLEQQRITAESPWEAMVDNVCERGGLTMLVFAWLALDGVAPEAMEAVYRAGAVLQLLDDLEDVQADAAAGVQTIWTRALAGGGSLVQPLRGTLAAQASVEEALASCNGALPTEVTDLLVAVFWLLLVRGIVGLPPELRRDLRRPIASRLPVGLKTCGLLRQELLAVLAEARRRGDSEALRLLERWVGAPDHPTVPDAPTAAVLADWVARVLDPAAPLPSEAQVAQWLALATGRPSV